tara:strand:+ start:2458 stop:3390 length:933 start_codon:yes stop_codon:yes gene_type:complete
MNLKKPKFWDYKHRNLLAYLLYPVSILIKIISQFKFHPKNEVLKIKTICVGNIYVGGTGKTSLCIKINKILNQKNIKSCFVKKYYKNQIDEQEILKKNGTLFLSKKRLDAVKLAEKENYEFAIFDDGLQDNSINYDASFVCFNNLNWIGNGMTIPSGPLRENLENLKKYQHLFLNGNLENLENLKQQILEINPEINIHIGKYEPINLEKFDNKDKYIIFSGIGNHQTFSSMIKKNGLIVIKEYEFPDHYSYTKKDIDQILNYARNQNCKIITTEKDYVRLGKFKTDQIKFIKSELKIIDEQKLLKLIMDL